MRAIIHGAVVESTCDRDLRERLLVVRGQLARARGKLAEALTPHDREIAIAEASLADYFAVRKALADQIEAEDRQAGADLAATGDSAARMRAASEGVSSILDRIVEEVARASDLFGDPGEFEMRSQVRAEACGIARALASDLADQLAKRDYWDGWVRGFGQSAWSRAIFVKEGRARLAALDASRASETVALEGRRAAREKIRARWQPDVDKVEKKVRRILYLLGVEDLDRCDPERACLIDGRCWTHSTEEMRAALHAAGPFHPGEIDEAIHEAHELLCARRDPRAAEHPDAEDH